MDNEANAYVYSAIQGFVNDPPDSPFQRGYLEALLVVWTEALGQDHDTMTREAQKLTLGYPDP